MKTILLTSIYLLTLGSSFAATILVNNHSFEDDIVSNGNFPLGPSLPADWSHYDPFGVLNYNNITNIGVLNPDSTVYLGGTAPDGENVAITWLNDGNANNPAGINQILTNTLQANTTYTLSVEVGNIGSGATLDLSGFPGYSVELWADSTMLVRDFNSLSIPEREFRSSSIEFTSGASVTPGQQLEIRLINLNINDINGPGIEVNFDNVQLDASPAAVPEPSSLLLVNIASLAFCLKRKRILKN